MLPDRVSNPGPLTYESGALPIELRGPATKRQTDTVVVSIHRNGASEEAQRSVSNRELNYSRMSYRFDKIKLFHCMNFK